MNNFTYFTDHDFKEGRKYIGASDVATLALMNTKYGQTPLTLWETITGRREPFTGNERSRAGKELEPIILKWGLEKLKYDERFCNGFLVSRYEAIRNYYYDFHFFTEFSHPDRPYLKAHLDLVYYKNDEDCFNMEAKAHGFYGAKREDDVNIGYDKDDMSANGIPASLYLQVQSQMLCSGLKVTYPSIMMDTGLHYLYGPIPAHKKTQEKILAITEKFWWHVEKDKPPIPRTWEDVVTLFPDLDKESKTVVGGEDEQRVIEMKERAKKLRLQQKKIKSEMDDLKNAVGLLLGGNAILESASGNKLASAYNVAKETCSLKDFKEKYPRKYKNMDKDGFINKSDSRHVRY